MLVLFLWLVVYVFTQVALDVGVPAAWFTRMPRCNILLIVVVSYLDFYVQCNCLIVQILARLRVWKSRGSSAVFSGASCLAFPPCFSDRRRGRNTTLREGVESFVSI